MCGLIRIEKEVSVELKNSCRIAAILLVLAQLFVLSAAADGSVSQSDWDKIKKAASDTAVASGVVSANSESSSVADSASGEKSGSAKSAGSGKVNYEIAPVTQIGTYEDVCIGGLEIHPGVWYTVVDGVLTSSEPWPDSYLFYSASQSKITLHEFHYVISGDTRGKDDTFAALYIPKDMQIVLEGDNEILNYSYTTFNGGYSNGIYAGNHTITFDGSGALTINTIADESLKGYGVAAGRIRIKGDFIGLSVFGMSGAFSVAPEVDEARDLVVRTGKIHPYDGGEVREGNPYDRTVCTRNRYVLFAAGKKLSEWEQMRARAYAEVYGAKADYEDQVEAEQIQAWANYADAYDNAVIGFSQGVDQGLGEMYIAMDEWQQDVVAATDNFAMEQSEAASQLSQMLMFGGG